MISESAILTELFDVFVIESGFHIRYMMRDGNKQLQLQKYGGLCKSLS